MVTQARPRKPTEDDFALCRGVLKHAWDTKVDTSTDAHLVIFCTRCTMTRYDWIDAIGGLQSRRYDPPPGYSLPRADRPTMNDARLNLIAQLTEAAGKPAARRPRKAPAKRKPRSR